MPNQQPSRRDFVRTTTGIAVGTSVPYFFSQQRTLADETQSKNDRLKVALIGAGGMGMGNMDSARDMCDVVAIADVDSGRLNHANQRLSGGKADTYADYREILQRDDLDAIHIATPDHWHTKPLIEALLAGHDVYCEKPLTLTIDEGKLIRKVVKETGRVVQVGTQQRSTYDLFVKAIALVAEGRIGKIKSIDVAIGGAPKSPSIPVVDAPGTLDWDRWLGPAPLAEYRHLRDEEGHTFTNCLYEFRWWYEYSGGKLTDWGAHHVDIATWALEANGQATAPLSVGGEASHPVPFENGVPTEIDRYNTATSFNLKAVYPGDIEMTIRNDGNGITIEGDEGRIFVNRGRLTGKPVEELAENPLPEDAVSKVYKGMPMDFNERKAHWANFFHCCRERRDPISDVHTHMKMLNVCHLAGISARLGRTVNWDAQTEQITGDEQANSMLARPYREGYAIEM
ncbi:4-carboxy-2-hydroxymuconate-6-semialdehyde dehydrogenase [Posidoniimonas corsicana]|uniref:4-carboxy-2-hydroxymuconate-6-semialdehyde dehydrogenase n=1 Tax=Posidoniimonas corsicana TaxID=1938618 RepID=A0A5C5VCZ7_9BACT|nr:Gfo/Idh/MocA family oxidoreductase [Posidoniimonas corsicana]TWT35749.1 4-carboxy-2-hydroxymuconate-6-semialdehyde dehydrogenase [Posidoniimonas corsicana]